jgi:hypothetical protein
MITTGFPARCDGRVYRQDTAVTCVRTAIGQIDSMIFDLSGAEFDCSNMTTQTAWTLGANLQASADEDSNIILDNFTLRGPKTTNPGDETNDPVSTTLGLNIRFAFNVVMGGGLQVTRFKGGIKTFFTFPLTCANQINLRNNWIGLHSTNASNQQHIKANAGQCRYSFLIEVTTEDTNKITNIHYDQCRTEGSVVGWEADPGAAGVVANIRNIHITDTYAALATASYDLYRFGRVHTFTTPETRGTSRGKLINNIFIESGDLIFTVSATAAVLDAPALILKNSKFTFPIEYTSNAMPINPNTSEVTFLGRTTGSYDYHYYDNSGVLVYSRDKDAAILSKGHTISAGGLAITAGDFTMTNGMANLGSSGIHSTITIATGAITVANTNIQINTEGAAASDDLDTINGGASGDILILSTASNSEDVVVKDSTGNIELNQSSGDCTLGNIKDKLFLIYQGSAWYEISRSINA